jgi:transcriptional regulator with XRE-family HTH domain
MAQGDSPVVARRRLRLALRQAREQKEFTQGQVASSLDWSLSKVQRIESGDVKVSRTDLTALLDHLGVSAPERVSELTNLARTSRRKVSYWWDEPPYKESLTPATAKLMELETEASEIRVFQPTLFPGVLQTIEYAHHILSFWKDELSEEDRKVRIETRMRRRECVFGQEDAPRYFLILDESVLLRIVGGQQVMKGQIDFLLSLMDRKHVNIRILPFDSSAALAMLNQFSVLTFGEGDTILYREAQLADEIIEASAVVDLYRQRFERMWEATLNASQSASRISRAAAMLENRGSGQEE